MSPSSPGSVEPREESGAAAANSSLNAATNGTLNATLPGTSFSGPPWPELNLSYSSWAAIICGVVVFWILLSLFLAYFFGPDFVTCYLCEQQVPRSYWLSGEHRAECGKEHEKFIDQLPGEFDDRKPAQRTETVQLIDVIKASENETFMALHTRLTDESSQ